MYIRHTHLTWLMPVLLGLSFAYLASGLALPKPDTAPPRAAPAPAREAKAPEGDGGSLILEKNILALAVPKTDTAASAGQSSGQRTADPSDWSLLGTIVGSRKAILLSGPKAGKTVVRLVFLGESVEGWELSQVTSDMASWKSGSVVREVALRVPGQQKPAVQTPSQAAPKEGTSREGKVVLNKAELAQYIDDPNNLLQQARFTPYKKDGKVEGFRLGNIRGDSVFRRMGLQNGDVLMSLNGEAIDGPEKLLRAYSGLGSAAAVNLSVRRQGEIKSLLVEFK
jgi:general secretion pathway protein C